MKKNLRNVLALFLGLMTTVSFAQDWNVDSRTRIDMSEAVNGEGYKMTNQRVTLGATWGGSDWAIHLSSDANYTLGVSADPSMSIYEAYASANLMGIASVTAGRQALNYGSGALMGTNDWNNDRNTWDGLSFGFDLDMADVTVGYASANPGANFVGNPNPGVAMEDNNNMWVNLGGEFSGWNVNVLYLTDSNEDDAAYGLDISGGLMGASVGGSMNTDYAGNSMRVVNLGYAVTDDINISVGQTAYGDENYDLTVGGRQASFNMANSNMNGSWSDNGGIGYLSAGDENLTYGLSYNMGGISLGASMHRITNTMDDTYERSAMEVNLGYSLGDNASLGLKYVTDDNGDATADESKYTWLTLTVTP